MTDDRFYDALETRDPGAREAELMAALPAQVARAKAHAPAYAALLDRVDPAAVTSRAALAALPVTRKAELPDRQRRMPPFGGLAATAPGALARVFASPGPIYEPEGHGRDWWRMARALHATGFRPGDLIQNCFAYHFTPAGAMFETGAHALGCAVIPAGTGNTELQARAAADLRPRGYVGTPDFLRAILAAADAAGLDATSLRLAHVSGGPLPPALRQEYEARGIAVFQSYGTADLGLIAYEGHGRDGLILDERVIVEIVRPGTGEPVPDGEVGEVVVTPFNPDYPLLRFATGDLSALLPPGPAACGRTNRRLRGWLGRADQATKVRGMFVHPFQVTEVGRRHGIARVRLVVAATDGIDSMTLRAESPPEPGLAERLAETLQAVTKLRGAVELVPPGSLPGDGRIIEDTRSHGGPSAGR